MAALFTRLPVKRPGRSPPDALAQDYANTTAMIFGAAPRFDDIYASLVQIEKSLNGGY